MIRDDVYLEELTRVIEPVDAIEESTDHDFFFMRRDKDRETGNRSALPTGVVGSVPLAAKARDREEKQVQGKP
jgi:hypothetical protein